MPSDRPQTGEERYYITEKCFVRLNTHELVHLKKTKNLTGDLWTFLHLLMERPESLVTYDEICGRVWGEKRENNAVSALMYRLARESFEAVGVNREALQNVLYAVRGKGVVLRPFQTGGILPESGNPGRLMELVRNSRIPERDFEEIVDCLLHLGLSGRIGRERLIALAHAGNKLAALELGDQYYYGQITRNHQPDYRTACEWYEKAGDHPVALWSLGYCILYNRWPVAAPDQIDYLKAKKYFDRTVQISRGTLTSAAALTDIGMLWETGHYPAPDFAETGRCEKKNMRQALSLYQRADQMGYHYATNRLGLYHEKKAAASPAVGAEDRKKAFDAFSRSVSLAADGYAFNKLGLYYEKGFGGEASADKACECFMRGVEDTLEDDITGWNYFNAGRVCANRISGQPREYYDLARAFHYFDNALRMLPARDHEQILLEMLEILSLESAHTRIPAAAILLTRNRVDSYLHMAAPGTEARPEGSHEALRKKAIWLEQLLAEYQQ